MNRARNIPKRTASERSIVERTIVAANSEFHSAHYDCSLHRKAMERSERVGCFYCLRLFQPSDITEWIDNGETALCPYCGIDAVLPDSAAISPEFLKAMHDYWFEIRHDD
jgi:hypothetical protein